MCDQCNYEGSMCHVGRVGCCTQRVVQPSLLTVDLAYLQCQDGVINPPSRRRQPRRVQVGGHHPFFATTNYECSDSIGCPGQAVNFSTPSIAEGFDLNLQAYETARQLQCSTWFVCDTSWEYNTLIYTGRQTLESAPMFFDSLTDRI